MPSVAAMLQGERFGGRSVWPGRSRHGVLGVRWGLWVAEGVGGMADRLFVDLAADGRVSVSTWLDGEIPGGAAGTPYPLAWPLDPDALEDLRWYLEVTCERRSGCTRTADQV
jgi:hypothetical protein